MLNYSAYVENFYLLAVNICNIVTIQLWVKMYHSRRIRADIYSNNGLERLNGLVKMWTGLDTGSNMGLGVCIHRLVTTVLPTLQTRWVLAILNNGERWSGHGEYWIDIGGDLATISFSFIILNATRLAKYIIGTFFNVEKKPFLDLFYLDLHVRTVDLICGKIHFLNRYNKRNMRWRSSIRAYNEQVPQFLHERPAWFIKESLDLMKNEVNTNYEIDSEGRCPCPAFRLNGIICKHILEQANRQGCLPDRYDDPMFVVDKHLIRSGKYSAWPNASSVLSWLIYESSILALESYLDSYMSPEFSSPFIDRRAVWSCQNLYCSRANFVRNSYCTTAKLYSIHVWR